MNGSVLAPVPIDAGICHHYIDSDIQNYYLYFYLYEPLAFMAFEWPEIGIEFVQRCCGWISSSFFFFRFYYCVLGICHTNVIRLIAHLPFVLHSTNSASSLFSTDTDRTQCVWQEYSIHFGIRIDDALTESVASTEN